MLFRSWFLTSSCTKLLNSLVPLSFCHADPRKSQTRYNQPPPTPPPPHCCCEWPEDASPPHRWDSTRGCQIIGACFPAQLFPLGSSGYFQPSQLSSNLRPRDGRCGQLRSQPVSSSSGTPRRPAPAAPLAPGRAAGSGPRRAAWRPSSPRLGPCNPLSSPVFREDANARGRLGCHPLRIRACVQGGPE